MTIKSLNLPPRAEFGYGYIYVIAFASGMVKVGNTANPTSRANAHAAYAKKLGTTIAQVWFSEEHRDYEASEERLITAMAAISARQHRNEFFTGVTFEQASGIAKTIFKNRARRPLELAWKAILAGDRDGAVALVLQTGLPVEASVSYVDGLLESLAHEKLAAA